MNLSLKVTPYAHQVEGISQHLDNEAGFANFSEQGTGKSLMAIGAMNAMGLQHVLIVCPNSLKANWEQEIHKFSSQQWLILVPKAPDKEKIFKWFLEHPFEHKVLIINYESLAKHMALINRFHPQMVIADEATAIKNHRTKRTKALKSILTRRRLAITGTPVANNPLDIWSIMDWVKPGLLGTNFYTFRNRHCDIYTGAGFPIIKGFKKLPEIKAKVDPISYRVLKSECLDLPEKVFTKREFDLTPGEARVYKQMADEMVAEIGTETVSASIAIVKLLRLQQITGGFIQNMVGTKLETHHVGTSKLQVLDELLEELIDQKVLIWARFKEEVRMITELCVARKRKHYKFTGDETPEQRNDAVTGFQSEADNAVMVGTAAAGGMGITLTAASHCVYYSNSFSLTERLQSQDRIHRIGQKNVATYYDIVARGTIDAYVLEKLEGKLTLSDKLTGDDLKKIMFDNQEGLV